MADGTSKPIEDVQLGEQVVATDPETGQTTAQQVSATWINQDFDLTDLVVLRGGTSEVIQTTWHHPFWNESTHTWMQAADLEPGQQLRAFDGQIVVVRSVTNHIRQQQMRDLTVANIHTY